MTAATNTAAVPDERAAFEEWARRTHRRPGTHFDQSHNGVYTDNRIAAKWAAWQARAARAQPAAAPMSGWISVDERLPAKGEHVIAYRPTAKLTQDDEIRILRYKACETESWQGVVHGFEGICHPTHWMPLPTAPGTEAAPVETLSDADIEAIHHDLLVKHEKGDTSFKLQFARAVIAASAVPAALTGAQFAAAQHLQTVQVQTEAMVALQAKCDLLSASLKQSDAVRDGLVAALSRMVTRIEYYASIYENGGPNIEQWAYTEASTDMEMARAALAAAGEQP